MEVMWGFGNTTVRNPNRIAGGLSVLLDSKYNGNIDGKENESGFAKILGENDIIALSEKSDVDSSGRKWRSCFSQLGFITHKFSRKLENNVDPVISEVLRKYPTLKLSGKPYEITPQGHRLATSESVIESQDIILRALLCYEFPSIIMKGNSSTEKFKPFVFVLQVLKALAEKAEVKVELSPTEMVALQVSQSHSSVDAVVNQIIEYRRRRESVEGKVKKSRIDREFREELVKNFGASEDSANTYADRNFRYLRATGLVSRRGKSITLNSNKESIVNKILDIEPKFAVNEIEYLFNMWNGYPIPTDDHATIVEEIVRLSSFLGEPIDKAELLKKDTPHLQSEKNRLEFKKSIQEEEDYASKQKDKSNINEIIDYLEALNGKQIQNENISIDDKPAFLEWATWRAFLAINNIVNKPYDARRFKIDQDFFPVGTAPGNGPDIIVEFDEYVLVVEVTLTTSSRQEAAEGEPVRRHIAIEKSKYDKPVYGLFIAGKIDNNTAETFRIGIWYRGDQPEFINIVPMTLLQFISIMKKFRDGQFGNSEFRALLDKCLLPRNAHAPLWKNEIEKEISYFSRRSISGLELKSQ